MTGILKISEAASLALHTAVLLAIKEDKVFSTGEIAREIKVSEAHLSKVLQRLTRAGVVQSLRGPKGGFKLARSPDEITLLQVYEALEGSLAPKGCLFESRICGTGDCILGGLIAGVNNQVGEYLAKTKLSDLTHVYSFMERR